MKIPLFYLIIYLISIIIFLILMGIAFLTYNKPPDQKKFPRYMIKILENQIPSTKYDTNFLPETRKRYCIFSRMVSGLGNLLCGSAQYFNTAVKLIGTTSTFLGFYVFSILNLSVLGVLGFIGFEIGCIGMILLGIFTENRIELHGVAAALSFGGYLGSLLFWIYPFISSDIFPNWIVIFNIIPFAVLIYHIVAIKGFDFHEQMQDIRIKELIKNYNFSEWLLFFCVTIWIILLFCVLAFG